MSGYVCPHCEECTNVWGRGGGEALANREGIHFLGRIPIDPGLVRVLDDAKDEAAEIVKNVEDVKNEKTPFPAGTDVTNSDESTGNEAGVIAADLGAGTVLSQTVRKRYRQSQTFPIFQKITKQIVQLAQEQESKSRLEALSSSASTKEHVVNVT